MCVTRRKTYFLAIFERKKNETKNYCMGKIPRKFFLWYIFRKEYFCCLDQIYYPVVNILSSLWRSIRLNSKFSVVVLFLHANFLIKFVLALSILRLKLAKFFDEGVKIDCENSKIGCVKWCMIFEKGRGSRNLIFSKFFNNFLELCPYNRNLVIHTVTFKTH